MTWEKELKDYTYYIKLEKKLSANTVEAYLRDLSQMTNFVRDIYNVDNPGDVKEEHVEAFMAHLFDNGVGKKTQSRVLSGVKSFFNYLLVNDLIAALPTEFVTPPKVGRKLPNVLSLEEIEDILDRLDCSTVLGLRNKAIIETLYSCGLRVTELVTLHLSDLFFRDGYIRVIGKGDKQRLVPVSQRAIELINNYLENSSSLRIDPKYSDSLFLNSKGKTLTRVMIFYIIRTAALAAGITKQISPHTFRHSFATHLLAGGADIRQVQEMLGHESILTTEIYTHLDKTQLRESIDQHHPLSQY